MASDCALAHACGPSWQQAVKDIVEQIGRKTHSANVGFLYITDHLAAYAEQIRLGIKQAVALDVLVGTIGMGVCCTGHEYMDEPAVVLLLVKLPAGSYREIHHSKADGIGNLGRSMDFPVGILHADPDLSQRLVSPDVVGDIFLTGGLTSSRSQSLQFHSNGTMIKGMSGLLMTDACGFRTGLSQGCSAIGSKHVITKCQDHILIELDHQPALDVLYEDTGTVPQTMTELEELCSTTLACMTLPNRDTDDYVARHLIGIDPQNRAIGIAHNPKQDDLLHFSHRNPQSARADLVRMLTSLKERLPGPPTAALYFSCVGRGQNLFGDNAVEPAIIREVFGDLPMAGFFSNGEMYQDEIYGYTGVLGVFC